MMQTHDAGRVDEYIAAALVDIVVGWFFRQLPLTNFLQVGTPATRPPQIPEGCFEHAVTAIELSVVIDQQWPLQPGLRHVLSREEIILERHYGNRDITASKRVFLLAQLREMPAAGESAEVAMEDQQQPAAAIIL